MQREDGMRERSATEDDARTTFAHLLERHRGILLKVAHAYARDPADREDLLQEIAGQLWRAYPAYDPVRRFTTWTYRIALNVAISHLRERQRRQERSLALGDAMEDLPDTGAADPEAEQRLRLLHAFIERQRPLDRALLLLYLDERPQREIAEVLGISETNVSTKIGRLKQRIRDEL